MESKAAKNQVPAGTAQCHGRSGLVVQVVARPVLNCGLGLGRILLTTFLHTQRLVLCLFLAAWPGVTANAQGVSPIPVWTTPSHGWKVGDWWTLLVEQYYNPLSFFVPGSQMSAHDNARVVANFFLTAEVVSSEQVDNCTCWRVAFKPGLEAPDSVQKCEFQLLVGQSDGLLHGWHEAKGEAQGRVLPSGLVTLQDFGVFRHSPQALPWSWLPHTGKPNQELNTENRLYFCVIETHPVAPNSKEQLVEQRLQERRFINGTVRDDNPVELNHIKQHWLAGASWWNEYEEWEQGYKYVSAQLISQGHALAHADNNPAKPHALTEPTSQADLNSYLAGSDSRLDEPNNRLMDLSADQFEAWTQAEKRRLAIVRQQPGAPASAGRPETLDRALMQRLQANRPVTDATVRLVVYVWSGWESDVTGSPFSHTKALVDVLVPLLAGRSQLLAQLHSRKAHLFSMGRDPAGAAKEYQKSLELLDPLRLEIDQQRIEDLVQLGSMLAAQGQEPQADAYLMEALSYPWYKVRDSDSFQRLRGLYVEAARMLINVRRKNLKALRELVLVPATQAELGPELQQAIKEAGG